MAFVGAFSSAYTSAVRQAWRFNAAWTTASKAAAEAATKDRGRTLSDYAHAFRSKKQSARDALQARLRPQPSVLDFSLRYQFRRGYPSQTRAVPTQQHPWAWGKSKPGNGSRAQQTPLHDQGRRAKLRMLLLEAYMGRALRHTPQSCPAHGRARTTPWCGGTGGGRYRIEFEHGKWRAWRSYHRRAHRGRNRMFRTSHEPCPVELATWFIDRQLDRGCRKIQHLNKLAPVTGVHAHANSTSNNGSGTNNAYCSEGRPTPTSVPNRSGFLRPRTCQPRPGGTLLASHAFATSHSFAKVAPAFNLGMGRLFSTSSCRPGHQVLLKAAFMLKSSTALHWINLLFRVSVSFIPLSLKRASWARKARLAQLATGAAVATPYWATVFKVICRGALALPFVLLVAVLLVAIERTPITGRLRLLLLNPVEEHDIVNKVLEIGALDQLARPDVGKSNSVATQERDWLSIMRAVLGEENAPAGTLLGGNVLPASDWRTHLVEQVLARLEQSVPALNLDKGPSSLDIEPPPLSYPLHNSARCRHLQPRNAVLVIDRPESNAFSFGFYGAVDQPQPGVIIVFTGAIDEILASRTDEDVSKSKLAETNFSRNMSHAGVQELSWLRSFFGSLVPPAPSQNVRSDRKPSSSLMSREQEEALAVLVAHELAHLVLSHTIESYATTALLWPQLEKLGWDMLRVFIYPVTAVLGPFVQDAISATVKVGIEESAEGRGLLPALTSSCESKKMEFEADAVALRLLANAGIDPRSAIHFWEERLFHQRHSQPPSAHDSRHCGQAGHLRNEVRHMHELHCDNDADAHSFIKTHPADQERIAAIKKELSTWRQVHRPPTWA